MKIISNDVSEISETNPLKKIELVGRTCYKSELKITDESAKKFVKCLVEHDHLAMVEHAVFTFCLPLRLLEADYRADIQVSPFMTISRLSEQESEAMHDYQSVLVSANLRSIIEGRGVLHYAMIHLLGKSYPDVLEAIGEKYSQVSDEVALRYSGYIVKDASLIPKEFRDDHSFKTFRFITDRGVTHELVRHRVASFGQESTRYCLYASDKFGNELTFIRPSTWDQMSSRAQCVLTNSFSAAESAYIELVANGLNAQQARAVLPNAVKTELVVTASETEWHHIGDLRFRGTTGAPHPDMRDLMCRLHEIYPQL